VVDAVKIIEVAAQVAGASSDLVRDARKFAETTVAKLRAGEKVTGGPTLKDHLPEAPDREALKAALQLRKGEWRDLLRGPHVAQARLILQHLIDLPIRIPNAPKPKWMTKTRPGGLLVGLVQSLASPTGAARYFSRELHRSLRKAA
jgi:hypothetical protein